MAVKLAPQGLPASVTPDLLLAKVVEVSSQLLALTERVTQIETVLQQRKKVSVRGHLSKSLKAAVQERDQDLCRYCGRWIQEELRAFDHYVPVSLGGTTTLGNLALACLSCNRRKGSTHPDLLDSIGMRLLPAPGEPDEYPPLQGVR